MKITFLGAAETVTGSKFLVEAGATRVLVDSGLFQGVKSLRLRNRRPLPVDLGTIDAVVLTHAHIDHSGYLPILVRDGFEGVVHGTPPTAEIAKILLPDSGRLQEEDARYANKKGYSKHRPATPLYTEKDAERVARRFETTEPTRSFSIGEIDVRFDLAGHILGAASVTLAHGGEEILFSGDIGRRVDPLLPTPAPPRSPRWVVMESTYGDRLHGDEDLEASIAEVVRRTVERKGILLIPAFAVGRTQTMLFLLERIFAQNFAPRVDVWVNSPMATDVTGLYRRFHGYHKLSEDRSDSIFGGVRFARSVDESKALNELDGPAIVISASGMLTGGRVLHHIRAYAGDPKNTILLAGYQAPGTRGHQLVRGDEHVRVHGNEVRVRAEIVNPDNMSAHADQAGLLEWIGKIERPPSRVFLVHGDPLPADELRGRIEGRLGFESYVPEHRETVELR